MIEQLTRKYAAAFAAKDLETIASLLADDFVLEDPVVVRVEGKAGALAEIQKIFDANPGKFRFQARNVYAAGQTSIMEFVLEVEGATLKGADIIEWRGERMAELRAYLDIPK